MLLDRKDRLRLGPVLLEAVVVALRWREDVDDDRAVVDEDPMRRGRALATDRADLLVAEAADDAVRDGLELALRTTRADDEVVRHRRQRVELEQDDVGGLLVLGQLDDSAGQLERRSIGRRGRLRPLGQAVGAGRGRDVGHGRVGHGRVVLRWCRYRPWSPIYAATASGTR